MELAQQVEAWVDKVRAKMKGGDIVESDLDELLQSAWASRKPTRQRLLYLYTHLPSIRSGRVISMALHEPVTGSITEITTTPQEWPYGTVHAAIVDGWRVIHFPDQRAPFDDHEIDILGFEFILQKIEAVDE